MTVYLLIVFAVCFMFATSNDDSDPMNPDSGVSTESA